MNNPTIQQERDSVPVMAEPSLVLLLSEAHERIFFGEKPFAEQLPGKMGIQIFRPDSGEDLSAFLHDVRPGIIVGAWSTPLLPFVQGRPPAKYYCHVCGSVRRQVRRQCIEQGMKVTHWGAVVAKTVAEDSLLLGLAALRNLGHHHMAIHVEGGWRREGCPAQKSLEGMQVGIHGFGAIARELVLLLRPFGVRISAWDPYVPESVFKEYGVIPAEGLEMLFQQNEILFECSALTPETRGIVSRELLACMPDDAVFVNTARGLLVDELALAEEVRSGRLRAGLDVFHTEPLPAESPLRGLPGLVVTPHVGGATPESRRKAGRVALENIQRFVRGEPLLHEVTLDQFDRMT